MLAGCEKKPTPIAVGDGGSAPEPSVAPAEPPTTSIDASGPRQAQHDDEADPGPDPCFDTTSSPKSGKSIGHTSTVFKLQLSNGKTVAWKPNAKNVKGRYKGEVAAYRLGRALLIDNVKPACLHVFDHGAVLGALGANPDAAAALVDQGIVENGKHYGATLEWIDGLQFWPLEKEPLRTEVKTWLTAGTEAPPHVDLARDASTLIAFDFITGNWDRYSGENVGLDKAGQNVLFIDNDAAFMESPPREELARNKARLDATDRFSKKLIEQVRTLDVPRLTAIFGDEGPGRPLLSSAVIELVNRRAKELVTIVDAKIAKRGERETLYFR